MPILELTKVNFEQVVTENEIVLLDFWADWCGPCKAFALTYENVSKKYPEIVFGKINTEQETELAEAFNVRSIPFLVVLRESIAVFAESGTMPETALSNLIEQAQQLDMDQVRADIEDK